MSNGAQKNMLKAWNFNQMKLHHRHSDNNLQKIFRKQILENVNGQVLLMVILMVGLCLEIFLSVWVFFHLTFMKSQDIRGKVETNSNSSLPLTLAPH